MLRRCGRGRSLGFRLPGGCRWRRRRSLHSETETAGPRRVRTRPPRGRQRAGHSRIPSRRRPRPSGKHREAAVLATEDSPVAPGRDSTGGGERPRARACPMRRQSIVSNGRSRAWPRMPGSRGVRSLNGSSLFEGGLIARQGLGHLLGVRRRPARFAVLESWDATVCTTPCGVARRRCAAPGSAPRDATTRRHRQTPPTCDRAGVARPGVGARPADPLLRLPEGEQTSPAVSWPPPFVWPSRRWTSMGLRRSPGRKRRRSSYQGKTSRCPDPRARRYRGTSTRRFARFHRSCRATHSSLCNRVSHRSVDLPGHFDGASNDGSL